MNCPRCKSDATRVLHTGTNGMRIQRRRECDTCTHRFNTFQDAKPIFPIDREPKRSQIEGAL